jgi:hypothetical protein
MRNESKIAVAKTDIERNHVENLAEDGRIILKRILKLEVWKVFYTQEASNHEGNSNSGR